MKKKTLIVAAALLLLALLGWAFMPAPTEVEVATVTQGRFERAVQEDGQTRVRDRYVVSAPLTGRVARIPLKHGDSVERGTTIATLWPVAPTMLDERSRAEQIVRLGALQAAQARTQAQVARAAAALEQARTDFKRSQALAEQGFVSPSHNDTGRLAVRLREKELESARQDETVARYDHEQARVSLRPFSHPPAYGPQRSFEIKAPVSGKVLKVLQPNEGVVLAGTPLLELGDPRQLEVAVDILTEDSAQIQPGTHVQLSHWGGAKVLTGQVRRVEPAAFTKVSALGVEEQRVNAVIDITSPSDQWPTLGDGYKVDVRVLVQVEEKAIKVPVSALFPVGGHSAIFILRGGLAHLQEVEVVARNGMEAWVKSGLAPGTEVIIYPDNKLRNGDRAAARAVNQR